MRCIALHGCEQAELGCTPANSRHALRAPFPCRPDEGSTIRCYGHSPRLRAMVAGSQTRVVADKRMHMGDCQLSMAAASSIAELLDKYLCTERDSIPGSSQSAAARLCY